MESSAVVESLDNLRQLYVSGFQNPFLDSALQKIIERQVARDASDLQNVDSSLTEFERRYGLSSEEFRTRFQAGGMNDTADYMEWNVLCKTRQRIVARLHILRGEETLGT